VYALRWRYGFAQTPMTPKQRVEAFTGSLAYLSPENHNCRDYQDAND